MKVVKLIGCGIVSALMLTGCEFKPNETQIKAIAQNAGLFSVVSWIAMDNPTVAQLTAVKEIVVVIEAESHAVAAGKTYTETCYPVVVIAIDTHVDAQYRPAAKAAAISILGGLDMLFAMNPDWKTNEKKALEIVASFLLGVNRGFSLTETHPITVEARKLAVARSQL